MKLNTLVGTRLCINLPKTCSPEKLLKHIAEIIKSDSTCEHFTTKEEFNDAVKKLTEYLKLHDDFDFLYFPESCTKLTMRKYTLSNSGKSIDLWFREDNGDPNSFFGSIYANVTF